LLNIEKSSFSINTFLKNYFFCIKIWNYFQFCFFLWYNFQKKRNRKIMKLWILSQKLKWTNFSKHFLITRLAWYPEKSLKKINFSHSKSKKNLYSENSGSRNHWHFNSVSVFQNFTGHLLRVSPRQNPEKSEKILKIGHRSSF